MTKAMLGHGAYDQNSGYQEKASLSYESMLRDAGRQLQPTAGSNSVTIVDYGCAQGRVSNPLLATAITAFREHDTDSRIFVCHNDQPSNDFAALLRNLAESGSYLRTVDGADDSKAPGITPLICPVSFYEPVSPRDSVNLGMSFAAAQWLSRPGPGGTGTALYFDQLDGVAQAQFSAQAHEDWTRFLSLRADELVPGGLMIMDMMGVPDDGQAAGHELWEHLREIIASHAAAGRIDQTRLDGYVLPVFERTMQEALRPFEEALAGRLNVESASLRHVENPLKARYLADGDAPAFAEGFTAFARAFSEPSLIEGLALDSETADSIYRELETRLTVDADAFAFEVYPLTLAFRAS